LLGTAVGAQAFVVGEAAATPDASTIFSCSVDGTPFDVSAASPSSNATLFHEVWCSKTGLSSGKHELVVTAKQLPPSSDNKPGEFWFDYLLYKPEGLVNNTGLLVQDTDPAFSFAKDRWLTDVIDGTHSTRIDSFYTAEFNFTFTGSSVLSMPPALYAEK
jgi:hypothetical protein